MDLPTLWFAAIAVLWIGYFVLEGFDFGVGILLPFLGKIKWEEHMAYLKEIGYKGNFNFEFAYGWFPDALLPQWLDMVHTTGEYLINL